MEIVSVRLPCDPGGEESLECDGGDAAHLSRLDHDGGVARLLQVPQQLIDRREVERGSEPQDGDAGYICHALRLARLALEENPRKPSLCEAGGEAGLANPTAYRHTDKANER